MAITGWKDGMKYELDSMNNLPTAPSYCNVKSERGVLGDQPHLWWLTYQRILENVSLDVFVEPFIATTVEYEPYGDLIPRRIRAARCDSSSDHGLWAVKAVGPG